MFSIQSMNINYIFNSIHQPCSSLLISNFLPVLFNIMPVTSTGSIVISRKTNTHRRYSDSVYHKRAYVGLVHQHTMKGEVLLRLELEFKVQSAPTFKPQNQRSVHKHYFKNAGVSSY